jgi:hypothetical protein
MSFGTASNYFTRSYGPNHRIIYEGVGRLLAELLVDTLDNLEDVEYTQLRAEFVATRLLYLVFPDEESVPVGDTHEETISFLLQTYEALLQGATKNSVDEVLNDIAEGNAVVVSTVEGYIANLKSSILATTEYNTDGVFRTHRHFAFTDESGLGSTNKPIEYKWGDELHTHDIVDGVIQPYIDADGNSHSHEVYLGIPENIIRLQNNLRKVLNITKPAHIKTGEVASIVDEDTPILAQGKGDVFSPILGIDPAQTDEQIIEANKIDPSLPYYNQNAQYGLVGVSLGSLYQEDMRKAREGVFEPNNYGYVEGKTIRFWRTNIKVADTLVIGTQKLRVISVSERIFPLDGIYSSIVDSNGEAYTYRTIRDLKKGPQKHKRITSSNIEVINGTFLPENIGPPFFRGELTRSEVLNDGEPIDFNGSVYFCDLMSDNDDAELGNIQTSLGGHTIKLSHIEVEVDAQITSTGLQVVKNDSSVWSTRDQVAYETVEFVNNPDPMWPALGLVYNYAINLPAYIVKDMLKVKDGLPVSIEDLTIKVNGVDVDYSYHTLSLEHTNTSEDANITNPHLHVLRIYDTSHEANPSYIPLAQADDRITLTYPKAKSEIRRFRELNSIEMTLNATRPTRKVSMSGRGGDRQNRIIETTSPISYVLNEPQPITPYTQEQKIATYSAGSSDLLNTSNQTLNTTYTLNNFSLNQTATQEQVFKPASSTVNTANPNISFYQLGFRPSYITSVIDSDGVSYTYQLNKDHVLINGLTEEKTLTLSGISSNPFDSNLDWYKGEKLAEGQAFFKHTSTINEVNGEVNVDLGAFTESTPEEYMTNPLGLAPDQIRSIYSMEDTQTSGVEGELTFYEDVITGYDLDGRDGFTNDYNPHVPQDEWLYPDPSLYILGPINIPTHFFFGYSNLNTSGGDGFYFSLYRIDAQGNRQYQTLSLRADSNGFTALEQYPNPVPNGSPLAYRFRDDSLGSPNTIDYDNAPAPNFLAEINASFNHLANETYFLEVFMEEDNGADYLYFLTSGTDANFDLESSWTTSPHAYRLDQSTAVVPVNNVTYTYEITFTLNPGEIRSFESLTRSNRRTTNLIEDNSQNIGYSANDNYATPPSINLGWKGSFETTGFFFTSVDDRFPSIIAELEANKIIIPGTHLSDSFNLPTDALTTTLLLTPSHINQSIPDIEDSVLWALNYIAVLEQSDFPQIEEIVEYSYILSDGNVSDIYPEIQDEVNAPVFMRVVPSSTISLITDEVSTYISGIGVSSEFRQISDEDGFLASYLFLPRSTSSLIPDITDEVSTQQGFVPVFLNDDVLASEDSVISYISSINFNDVVDPIEDALTSHISSFNAQDTFSALQDSISLSRSITIEDVTEEILDSLIVPRYMSLDMKGDIPALGDLIATSLALYVDDTTPQVLDGNIESFLRLFTGDTVSTTTDSCLLGIGIPLEDTFTFNADAIAFISSTNQSNSENPITVVDDVDVVYNVIAGDYVYMALKYPNGWFGFELHIYEAGTYMDSLVYVNSYVNYVDAGQNTYTWTQETTLGRSRQVVSPVNPYSIPSLNAWVEYDNADDTTTMRIGPLDEDKDYTIFFQATAISDVAEICPLAMKRGRANTDPVNYLSGETYTDLGNSPTGTGTLNADDRYFKYHTFRLRSVEQDLLFTEDQSYVSEPSVNYGNDFTTVYFYMIVNANANNEFWSIRICEADNTEVASSSNLNNETNFIEPTVHTTPVNGINAFNNQVVNGTFLSTYGYRTYSNPDNIAPLSYSLLRAKRYKMIAVSADHPGVDVGLFIRANPVIDTGASYNTVYNSSDTLTYTNLFQKDVNTGTVTYRHYFYIRDDGFVAWEHDPASRP